MALGAVVIPGPKGGRWSKFENGRMQSDPLQRGPIVMTPCAGFAANALAKQGDSEEIGLLS